MRALSYQADEATVQALRSDVALQVARYANGLNVTQAAAAKQLGLPQPTLSKIANGRVSDLSLELLIRVAVRAGLPITLQNGHAPQEAGAYLSSIHSRSRRGTLSKVADEAREALTQSEARLTPSQRLEAFLEHNQLMAALHQAGRATEHRELQKLQP